jgi:1-acyl-sn-glycerol-3-phosphate acyltransferase
MLSSLRTSYRVTRLFLLLLEGVLKVITVFPFVSLATRREMKRRWSRRLLGVFSIRLQVTGEDVLPGSLIVANHVSWLDVYAINALMPVSFVAKSEVRSWPIIGWLSTRTETIFLRRGSRGHAHAINEAIGHMLASGGTVAVFPEGTTTDGTHLLPFHAALMQPAISAGHPMSPVAICYRDGTGAPSSVAAYVGEMTLVESLFKIAAARTLTVDIWIGRSLTNDVTHRRELAAAARSAIAERLGLDASL